MKRFLVVVSFVWMGLVLLFVNPSVALAACTPDAEVQTDFGCIPNNPVGFVSKFYGIGLGFIGGVALLAIIYGGYALLTSRGDPQQLEKGKSYIFYAIAGLLLAIFGFVFIEVIAVDILKIPGFTHS